jgi:hypothetical protein
MELFEDRPPLFPYEYGITTGIGIDESLLEAMQMYEDAYAPIVGPAGTTTWNILQTDLGVEYKIQYSAAARRMVQDIWSWSGSQNPAGGIFSDGKGTVKIPFYNTAPAYIVYKYPYTKGQLLATLRFVYPNGLVDYKYVYAKVEEPATNNVIKARGRMYWDIVGTRGMPNIPQPSESSAAATSAFFGGAGL